MSLLVSGSYCNGITFSYDNRQEELNLVDLPALLPELVDLEDINAYYNWGLKFQIESLRATYWLAGSLTKVDYANIYPEDSQSARINKLIDQENVHRLGVQTIRKQGASSQSLSRQLFQNLGREQQKEMLNPYITRGSVKLLSYLKSTGVGDILAYKLNDYGNGLIKQYTDYIQIEADCTYYFTGYARESINTISNSYGGEVTTTPRLLLPANNRRVKLNMVNVGTNTVSFHYGDQAGLVIGSTLQLEPGGSSWNDEGFFIDRGPLWVVCHEGTTNIVGKEMVRV